MKHFWTVCITPQPCHSHSFVDYCQFGPSWMFRLKLKLMACAKLFGSTTKKSCIFSWPYNIVSMIWTTFKLYALHLSRATSIFVVDCCQFDTSWMFQLKMKLMACAGLVASTTKQSCIFSWPYMIVSMIWNTFKLSVLHLSHATSIFLVYCCQFGPSWMFGMRMELMACADFVGGKTEQICIFSWPDIILLMIWNTY